MPKKDYLSRQRAREQEVFDAGLGLAVSRCAITCPWPSGTKRPWGRTPSPESAFSRVLAKINDLIGVFSKAFEKCDEADYYQDKLDSLLREAYADEITDGFYAFHDRYECVKQFDYKTGKWR